ncbi:MAG TPA: AarF/UbiB family protein [Acidimicrobiales bacterium]|nr:AarF/UbiB family protein [Acidimicrobiales bacterium]
MVKLAWGLGPSKDAMFEMGLTTRRHGLKIRPVDSASNRAALDDGREMAVTSLLRRGGKIAAVAAHRSARIGWHAAASRLRPHDIDQAGSFPLQLRLALEELGPTFVKLGQLLSARSDITPPQVQQELSKLLDHAPNIPQAKLVTELERSLGSPSGSLFATLEMVPVACASIGQVHRGTLHNGLRVAVKVRRPGVRTDIDADFWLLRKLAHLLARVSARVRAYDPVAILDEFAALLHSETDFKTEAGNLEAVRRTFEVSDAVTIPRVLTDMSGESVLVMDWLEGIPLSNRERLEAAGTDRAGLARAILQAYAMMIFQCDRFHADPHPGNLIALEGGRLGLIDFGEVGSVGPAERSALLEMMKAVLGRDGEALAGVVLSVSRTTRPIDRADFGTQLATLLDPVVDASLKDVRLGEMLGRLLHLLRNSGIVLPSDLAILIKTMIECEATTNELDPTLSMLDLVSELGTFAPTPRTTSRETSLSESSN